MIKIDALITSGAKDIEFPNEEGVITSYRLPVYNGTTPVMVNVGLFERVTVKYDKFVYVPVELVEHFDGMGEAGPVAVAELTFERQPFPEQILMGKENKISYLVFLEEAFDFFTRFEPPMDDADDE